MSFGKFFKRLKLKKLRPGVIVKDALHAAAAANIPGARGADALATRVGERVDQFNRVVAKSRAEIERYAKDNGVSYAEASDALAKRALSGAEAGLAFQANKVPILLVVGGAVLLFFLLRRK